MRNENAGIIAHCAVFQLILMAAHNNLAMLLTN